MSQWRLAVPLVSAAAGMLFSVSALNANGGDLRPAVTDLSALVQQRSDRVAVMRSAASQMRRSVDTLSAGVASKSLARSRGQIQRLRGPAGMTQVTGPGARVILTDAPRDVEAPGLNPNLLVVHQQDIQAFVNALWAGGAKAVTLQGQRLISTTGVKCVGNTVVLDGVPYAPPYVIEAVGDPTALRLALEDSSAVRTYQEYVDTYRLGLSVSARTQVVAPAYEGTIDLTHASVVESNEAPS